MRVQNTEAAATFPIFPQYCKAHGPDASEIKNVEINAMPIHPPENKAGNEKVPRAGTALQNQGQVGP